MNEQRISPEDSALDPAVAARLKRDPNGLVAAIAQQYDTGEVLMLGWMDDEALLSPHLIIVGGGVSKQSEKWVPRLTGIRARIVPAALLNDAGIVGAAMATGSGVAPDTSGATGVR